MRVPLFPVLIGAITMVSCDFDDTLTDPPADTGQAMPCDACAIECGDDTACFNACAADVPGCSLCLDPFFDCSEQTSASECTSEFCDCLSGDLCG